MCRGTGGVSFGVSDGIRSVAVVQTQYALRKQKPILEQEQGEEVVMAGVRGALCYDCAPDSSVEDVDFGGGMISWGCWDARAVALSLGPATSLRRRDAMLKSGCGWEVGTGLCDKGVLCCMCCACRRRMLLRGV